MILQIKNTKLSLEALACLSGIEVLKHVHAQSFLVRFG